MRDDEIGNCIVRVRLGVQPSTSASSRRSAEVNQERASAVFCFRECRVDVVCDPVDWHLGHPRMFEDWRLCRFTAIAFYAATGSSARTPQCGDMPPFRQSMTAYHHVHSPQSTGGGAANLVSQAFSGVLRLGGEPLERLPLGCLEESTLLKFLERLLKFSLSIHYNRPVPGDGLLKRFS